MLLFTLVMPMISCQSAQTKSELYGKWACSDGTFLGEVWLYRDNTFSVKVKGLYISAKGDGIYSVTGRTLVLNYFDGYERYMRLAEDHCLYNSAGSRYVKVEDY